MSSHATDVYQEIFEILGLHYLNMPINTEECLKVTQMFYQR